MSNPKRARHRLCERAILFISFVYNAGAMPGTLTGTRPELTANWAELFIWRAVSRAKEAAPRKSPGTGKRRPSVVHDRTICMVEKTNNF